MDGALRWMLIMPTARRRISSPAPPPICGLATSDIITWNDYRKEDGQQTFGLLSHISPDGRYVLSTVKDRSVFVPRPGLAFSQLFFPLKGILAAYDREEKRFFALPGADDPRSMCRAIPPGARMANGSIFARNLAAQLEKPADASRVLSPRTNAKSSSSTARNSGSTSIACVQRRKGRKTRAAPRGIRERAQQLFPKILPGRAMDRLLSGLQLHAASTGQ